MIKKVDNKIIILALVALAIAIYFGQLKTVVETGPGSIPGTPLCTWNADKTELTCPVLGPIACNIAQQDPFINKVDVSNVWVKSSFNPEYQPWSDYEALYSKSCLYEEQYGTTEASVRMQPGLGFVCSLSNLIPIDTSSCGVTTQTLIFGGNVIFYNYIISCTENWNCTAWSSCSIVTSTRIRTCTDLNECGTAVNKSAESEACTPFECTSNATSVTECEGKTHIQCVGNWYCDSGTCAWECEEEICIPDWDCSAWSTCVNSEQTRACTDSNSCNNVTGKPAEWQSCHVNVCEDFGYSTGTLPQATYDCVQIRAGGLDCWRCTKKENILFQYWYLIVIAAIAVGVIYYKKFR